MTLPAFLALAALAAGAGAAESPRNLSLALVKLDCSRTSEGEIHKAVSQAASLLKPCGIVLNLSGTAEIKSRPRWCELPGEEAEFKPLLHAMAWPERKKQPRGLTLFLLPSGETPRWSFALVDRSKGAGCGSPMEARFLHRFGSLFMTDFSFKSGDSQLPGLLLAHEIAHALSMQAHPSRAARGTVLADHLADIGPKIPPRLCACMRQSPYLQP